MIHDALRGAEAPLFHDSACASGNFLSGSGISGGIEILRLRA